MGTADPNWDTIADTDWGLDPPLTPILVEGTGIRLAVVPEGRLVPLMADDKIGELWICIIPFCCWIPGPPEADTADT